MHHSNPQKLWAKVTNFHGSLILLACPEARFLYLLVWLLGFLGQACVEDALQDADDKLLFLPSSPLASSAVRCDVVSTCLSPRSSTRVFPIPSPGTQVGWGADTSRKSPGRRAGASLPLYVPGWPRWALPMCLVLPVTVPGCPAQQSPACRVLRHLWTVCSLCDLGLYWFCAFG